jgi:uncharacterized protein DUF4294
MLKNVFLLFMILSAVYCQAQTQPANSNDTNYTVKLKEVQVLARWKNDTDRYRYNQMKFYVTTILPYMNAAAKLFKEIHTEAENPDVSRKEYRQFINEKEDEMRTQFEDRIKELNVTQGVLLVKLIARQTDLNIYRMLLEFKNPLVAIKWQGWARLHGLNLDKKYRPEDEHDLEMIMEELGYPLPGSYADNLQ